MSPPAPTFSGPGHSRGPGTMPGTAVKGTQSSSQASVIGGRPGAVCRRQAMRPGLMIGAWCVSSAAAFSVPTSSLFVPLSPTLRRPLPLSSRRLASSARAGGEMLARGTATGHSTTIRSQASRQFHRSHASHGRGRSGSAAVLLGGIGAASLFSLWGSADGQLALRAAHSEAAAAAADGSYACISHKVGHTNVFPDGLRAIDHTFAVPLDHADPSKGTIEVFARELVTGSNYEKRETLPMFVFLQGGPGFQCARPTSSSSGWVGRALTEYRVLLIDQRGTGRSTPVTHETLGAMKDAETQAQYLANMRADSIVRDCEAIRTTLLGAEERWTVLGQSFGGFCLCTYLSLAPHGLKAGFFTGGLPPIEDEGCTADKVYDLTYPRMAARSEKFYKRYPQHVETVREIVSHLEKKPQTLPSGGTMTARRFLQLGLCLGGGGGIEQMHYLLESPWVGEGESKRLSFDFLVSAEAMSSFETNPMYAVMHESIYCSGKGHSSNWSAGRRLDPRFDHKKALANGDPIMFFGEHTFDWMYEDYDKLRGLKDAAMLIGAKKDWGKLYDSAKLKACSVPTAAAMYYDDVYVERLLSEETAAMIGSEPGGVGTKVWVTNEYQHSGIRDDGYKILDKLLGMVGGTVNVPS